VQAARLDSDGAAVVDDAGLSADDAARRARGEGVPDGLGAHDQEEALAHVPRAVGAGVVDVAELARVKINPVTAAFLVMS